MRSIFYTLLISSLAAIASAFSTGSGTCLSDQTTIEGVSGSPMGKMSTGLNYGFAIKMDNNNYVPKGSAIKVSITGKTAFKGLLIYAVDAQKNHVGKWQTQTGYKLLTQPKCQGDESGTLTHSDASSKGPNVDLMWTPPDTDVGPINFLGTVVQSATAGFQIVKSANTYTVAGSKLGNNTATTPGSNPTGNGPQIAPTGSPTSDASSLTKSALLLQLTAAISLLFYYL